MGLALLNLVVRLCTLILIVQTELFSFPKVNLMKIYKRDFNGVCFSCGQECKGLNDKDFGRAFKDGMVKGLFVPSTIHAWFLKYPKDMGICPNCDNVLLQCPYCKTWQLQSTFSSVQQCDSCTENFRSD